MSPKSLQAHASTEESMGQKEFRQQRLQLEHWNNNFRREGYFMDVNYIVL